MSFQFKQNIGFSRREFMLSTMSFLIASCTSGRSTETTQSSTQSLRLGINPWAGLMPFKVAESKGFFAENGLDIKLTLFQSISDEMNAFNSGNIDVVVIDPTTLLISATAGVAQKFVFITDFSAGADGIIAVPSIQSVKDFAGKSISVEIGTIGHFLLLKALSMAGVPKSSVKLINQTADAAIAAFVAGKTEIAVSYEPFITQAIKQGKGQIVFSSREIPKLLPDVVSVHQKFLDTQSSAIPKLIRTWYQAIDFRAKNPDVALPIEAKALGVSVAEYKALSKGVKWVTTPQDAESYFQPGASSLVQIFSEVEAFALEQKLLSKRSPEIKKLVEGRFINDYLSKKT